MKKLTLILAAVTACCLGFFNTAKAADTPVKREMRSAWVATVWRLDWPSVTISSTGNTSNINRQKQDMTQLLDSLSKNNFNAINFQIRSRCDAMYKSSYEPWSSDLVSARGMEPGWDPLEWIVEECHKRGMECHAWVNPYRYESQIGQWNDDPTAYRNTHPEWLLDVNGASILNPARQDVIDQIVRVIREVVQNYDIDGVLFDDYFYLSGTPTGETGDGKEYAAYKEAGGTLSQGDWRRDNVNRMVRSVYNMIQEEKPWVRFGVSPAGIACTTKAVADRYGITPCPTGSDWQYSDIYSDPIAWLNDKSIDFISPQIYWTIGNSTDYDAACKWWSEVAAKFGRHFYSSHSISSLTASSKAVTTSLAEQNVIDAATPMATGPNSSTYNEYSNEIRLNREYTLNDAPGSIFYSCKYIYKTSPLFGHHLKKTVFNTPALVPAITYKPGNNPGVVKNLSLSGKTLTWSGYDNVRYTVYAVPVSVPVTNFDKDAQYLLGTTYTTTYTLDNKFSAGYNIAVCVLDRFGNEYSPVFLGKATKPLASPSLLTPADNEIIEAPFTFSWTAVEGASAYTVEMASDPGMTDLIATTTVYTNTLSTSEIEKFPLDKKIYWRVRAMGNGFIDGLSPVRNFTASQLIITNPCEDATEVSTTPTITWSIKRDVTVEIYSNETLTKEVYTAHGSNSTHTIPTGTLSGATTYWVRLSYLRGTEACTTPVVKFTTAAVTPVVPEILFPATEGKFNSEHEIKVTPLDGAVKVVLNISASEKFPSRSTGSKVLTTGIFTQRAGDMQILGKDLVPGTKYYLRAKATYNNADGTTTDTEYSPTVAATYMDSASAGEIIGNSHITITDGILNLGDNTTGVEIFTPAGVTVMSIENATGTIDLTTFQPGIYIIRAADTTLKTVIR